MDYARHLEEITQWYCERVKEPAWREYVLDRVEYMASRQPMYRPLLESVKAAAIEPLPSGTPSSPASPARSNP